ncbi:mechanosensitive ion channel domain-containing protein [Benzoatithermus flavus]|uniref:Mechanosensitive ion channel family protein n=1 Tax=Benzoatithermus flavus TaxID=3108223 RepID=A0ABU8XLS6_9PROT
MRRQPGPELLQDENLRRSKRGDVMEAIRTSTTILAVALAAMLAASPATAQDAGEPAPPTEVQELLRLLARPSVRAWLEQQPVAVPPPVGESPAQPAVPGNALSDSPQHFVAARLTALRDHLQRLAEAVPKVPAELERAWLVLSLEFEERGLFQVLPLIAAFIALGFGVEWLFWRATTGIRARIGSAPLATVAERLHTVGTRFAFGLGLVTAFALGSVGAFLAFEWPPLLKEIVLGYLLAFLSLRLSLVVGRFLLAPGGRRSTDDVARFRIVPMTTEAARFWHRWLGAAVGWFAFGYVTIGLLRTLGTDPAVRLLAAYTLGLGLLAIGLYVAWHRPAPGEPAAGSDAPASRSGPWLVSAYFVLLWLLWVAAAMPAFWLAVVAAGLPLAIGLVKRSVDHLLRPPGATASDAVTPPLTAILLERGLRALLIIGAAWLLAWAWDLDLASITSRDTMSTRLLAGALNAVVIVLLADLVWHLARADIDCRIQRATSPADADTDEARRQARLRTLLPIVRNILFVLVIVTAGLMALSALGVQIGPLLAGAGVVGVAIGFGAQTLVKDIISGVFFLLDDAFRVGEYIESGNIRGTVESFSLRSVKLRHHRGYLHTVPFGSLHTITNYSRDWVIDKLTLGVTYDTDLDKAKRIIKQIGKELAADPELAPNIIETLKMQGVEEYADFAIKIRLKMTTKPGEQFVIRRKALALIKKAFAENGIKFAYPTVQVAGGESTAAAAQAMLEATQKPAA